MKNGEQREVVCFVCKIIRMPCWMWACLKTRVIFDCADCAERYGAKCQSPEDKWCL